MRGLRVLIACERSGIIREAFNAYSGVEAFSCDLEPCEDGRRDYHIQGDCLAVLAEGWDLLIAHPECTFLTNSAAWAFTDGPYHQKVKLGTLVGAARRKARDEAAAFALKLWNAPIRFKCIENPIGHLSRVLGRPAQVLQPHQFGADASKATCIWLDGLPTLELGERIPGRLVMHNGRRVERWANQTDAGQNRLSPSDRRSMDRARTYPGIAAAMPAQWIPFIISQLNPSTPCTQTP